MRDKQSEAALVRLLSHVGDADGDAVVADGTIDVYLSRFGDDHAERLAAIRRLTTKMLATLDTDESRATPDPALRHDVFDC